jgi:pimeloyl-ACP methyl ester carboxylesterase
VVLVPGLGLDERSSTRIRERVPGTVVRLPGMGLAAPVPSVDDLAVLLRAALGEGPVVLVGHSQSCQQKDPVPLTARMLAASLWTGPPTTDPRLRATWGLAWRWLATALAEPVRQVPRILAHWWATGPCAVTALWRRAAPDRIDVRLRDVGVPVTVVRGTRDRLCPHDWAARLAAAAPQGRLVELPGAAYMRKDPVPLTTRTLAASLRTGPLAPTGRRFGPGRRRSAPARAG